jgi:hypothetical protein
MMLIIKDCRVLDLEKPATRIQLRNAPARRRFMAAYRTAAAVLAALACLIPQHTPLSAQTNVQSGANDALDRLQWRELGPAVMGGRIDDFAVVEKNPDVIYAATASGGIWRTTDGGITWQPIFEHVGPMSIGAIAVSLQDPSIVWAARQRAPEGREHSAHRCSVTLTGRT